MIGIPSHGIQPADVSKFVPEAVCRPLQSAGLGYTIMKALGAHRGLSRESINTIQVWCQRHCEQYPDVVPDERELVTASFEGRLFRPGKIALENAVRYPGAPEKPSYLDMYQMVWVEQRWPELSMLIPINANAPF